MEPIEKKLRFSTRGLPRNQRMAKWDAVIAEHYGKFHTEPGLSPFEARFDASVVGGLTAIRSTHNAKTAQRTYREIDATDPRNYFVILQLQGSCEIAQGQHKATLMQGDVTILDSRLPCAFHYGEHTAQFTLLVPCAALDQRGIAHREVLAVALRGAPSALIGSMLRISFGSAHSWTDVQGAAIADALINFIAATWTMRDQAMTDSKIPAIPPIVQSIQAYIVGHLGASGLAPTSIATEFGLSVRHLHRLFESSGTSLSHWIRRIRLDRCAIDLLDESLLFKSITEICFRWGFSDSAHFSRAFKAEFGLSPRQYRQQRMEIQLPSPQ